MLFKNNAELPKNNRINDLQLLTIVGNCVLMVSKKVQNSMPSD